MTLDPKLLEFCQTARQRQAVQAVIKEGSFRKAAEAIGINNGTLGEHIAKVRAYAASRGYAPEYGMNNIVPSTHIVKKNSMMFRRGEDEPLINWVQAVTDPHQLKIIANEMGKAFFENNKPLPKIKPPKEVNENLLTCYVIADLHLGMYSWARETGEDYDCDIASSYLLKAMDRLALKTPPSRECLVAQLGDMLHMDDDSNSTRRSGNSLDVDTRYQRVAEVGFSLYRRAIDRALERHETVKVVNVPGNHDDVSGMWLGIALQGAYANNPRVIVDKSPGAYFYHRFGNNLIGMAHGHTCKMANLGDIMLADRPMDTGECEFRYWLTGHIHHEKVLETRTCRAESFRTLAAKDAWHSMSGYRSKRDMKAIVFHRDHGEEERYTVSVKELSQKES